MKQFNEIPKNAFIININVDSNPAYADVVENDEELTGESVQYEIPAALAYYLEKHRRGTDDLQLTLRQEFQKEVREVLGLKSITPP